VADGEIVDMSMTRAPSAAPSATPFGPNRTASTSGVSETIRDVDLAGGRYLRGAREDLDAKLDEAGGAARAPVPGGDVEARARDVRGHRAAHRSETNETDAHCAPP